MVGSLSKKVSFEPPRINLPSMHLKGEWWKNLGGKGSGSPSFSKRRVVEQPPPNQSPTRDKNYSDTLCSDSPLSSESLYFPPDKCCTCLIIVPKLHPTRLKSILLNEEEGKTRREGSSSREEEEMILKERRDFERQRERERKRNKRLEKRFLTKGEKCIEAKVFTLRGGRKGTRKPLLLSMRKKKKKRKRRNVDSR